MQANSEKSKSDNLPFTVVAGPMRTGTSLMMQCLRASGFNIGRKKQLRGGYFICELLKYSEFNNEMLRSNKETFCMITPLENEVLKNSGKIQQFKIDNKLHRKIWGYIYRNGEVKYDSKLANNFIKFIDSYNINALKAHGLTIDFWLNHDKFKKAKFIMTTRNKQNIIESMLNKEKAPTKEIANCMLENLFEYLKCVEDYDHILVEFENMQTNAEIEGQKIANFLGIKKFDVNSVNNKMWHFKP